MTNKSNGGSSGPYYDVDTQIVFLPPYNRQRHPISSLPLYCSFFLLSLPRVPHPTKDHTPLRQCSTSHFTTKGPTLREKTRESEEKGNLNIRVHETLEVNKIFPKRIG